MKKNHAWNKKHYCKELLDSLESVWKISQFYSRPNQRQTAAGIEVSGITIIPPTLIFLPWFVGMRNSSAHKIPVFSLDIKLSSIHTIIWLSFIEKKFFK